MLSRICGAVQVALHGMRRRHMAREIEAETHLALDRFLDLLAAHVYGFSRLSAAAELFADVVAAPRAPARLRSLLSAAAVTVLGRRVHVGEQLRLRLNELQARAPRYVYMRHLCCYRMRQLRVMRLNELQARALRDACARLRVRSLPSSKPETQPLLHPAP